MAHNIVNVNGATPFARLENTEKAWWEGMDNTIVANIVPLADKNDPLVWAKAAGLDFNVRCTNVIAENPSVDQSQIDDIINDPSLSMKEKIDLIFELKYIAGDRYFTQRTDNGILLTDRAFTSHYKPVQPAEMLQFLQQLVSVSENFVMDTAAALKQGRIVWTQAQFLNDEGSNETQILGEKHKQYVNLFTSMDGSLATSAMSSLVRVVCNNTLTAAMYDDTSAVVKIRHNAEFSEIRQEYALDKLREATQSVDVYRNLAEKLVSVKISKDKAIKFIRKMITGNEDDAQIPTRSMNNVMRMQDALTATQKEDSAAGGNNITAWTLLNAATRYNDHMRGERKTQGRTGLDMIIGKTSGVGSADSFKSKAVELLMEIAETKQFELAA